MCHVYVFRMHNMGGVSTPVAVQCACVDSEFFLLIYFCVLSLAVNVELFPLRAASSALSAAQDHSWVTHHVQSYTHIHTMTQSLIYQL